MPNLNGQEKNLELELEIPTSNNKVKNENFETHKQIEIN